MTTYPEPVYRPASGDFTELLNGNKWRQQAMEAETLIKGDVMAGIPGRPG